MTAPYPKRLIEVDLPIARISAHARREKSIRHGHISTLHIWWARRPLAACRAVICAALWPDPADELCPPEFRSKAIELITRFAKRVYSDRLNAESKLLQETGSAESLARWESISGGTLTLDAHQQVDWDILRLCLLDFIADFANWDNSTVPAYLETARALTQAAHESLGGEPGTRPLVVDPFAGGGSIPLEALRVGADAFASDLNPIPVLLNKVLLEYIPKYGKQLAEEVRKWGEWIKREAEKELAEFYPKDPDGATPIAYLWARTIRCEGPSCGAEVPLIRSLWLAKKANRSVALRLIRNPQEKRVDLDIIVKQQDGWVSQSDLKSQIANPTLDGTVKRGSATCPCCGYTTPVARVREQLKERRGGTSVARLLAVIVSHPNEGGRRFRTATSDDATAVSRSAVKLANVAKEDGKSDVTVPTEEFSGLEPRRIPLPQYGMNGFGDLFGPRQSLTLIIFAWCIRKLDEKLDYGTDSGLSDAVMTLLAFVVDRLADKLSSIARWDSSRENPQGTFARQALPMVWDFSEVSPFSGGGGDWDTALGWVAQVVEREAEALHPEGQVTKASATNQVLPSDSANALITDPPYYYSVPYSDLSDFFYVWLKRGLSKVHPQLFQTQVTPKDEECVQNLPHSAVAGKQKDRQFYERTMAAAFDDSRRVVMPSGIAIVVFAHSDTEAWEALVNALVSAGWCVTASWPIDTEMANRVLANRQSTLASSVHLVCRPREDASGEVTESVGEWRDILGALPKRIHEWMPRLAAEGVVGADAIFACLGPALEIFSRYSRVEKASGETATLREYLEHVWAAVSTEALSLIFKDADAAGLEPDARLTAMWLWTVGGGANGNGNGKLSPHPDPLPEGEGEEDADDEGESATSGKTAKTGGFHLEYDAARKIAQGLGVHLEQCESLVEVKGDKARLLPVSERTQSLFGTKQGGGGKAEGGRKKKKSQKTFFDELSDAEVAEEGWGELKGPPPGSTVLDRLHQAMILFAAGRGELMKRFLVEDGVGKDTRFWKLADNLNKLYPPGTDERRWVEGVLARKKGLGF